MPKNRHVFKCLLMTFRFLSLTTALLLSVTHSTFANDFLNQVGGIISSTNKNSTLSIPLSQDQMVNALKEALGKGVQQAVSRLGQTNGFLTNVNVRIPLPDKLASVEKTLRSMKQEKLADSFVLTMNRAAEQAVPAAVSVFADSLKQMSIDDAKNVLTGTTNAATQFFRRTTETNLYAKFLPIVKKATASSKVTDSYKAFMAKAQEGTIGNSLSGFGQTGSAVGGLLNKGGEYLGKNTVDIDAYVTQKALDGLFKMVAEEEKKIRENPAARSSELLQKVFGAVKK
ncbi:MAG: hypothetical protein JWM68_4691 [Verrucomicrobiales bacterium]|nr:hypothetical protein [Verrucomicrobiales bacterium]